MKEKDTNFGFLDVVAGFMMLICVIGMIGTYQRDSAPPKTTIGAGCAYYSIMYSERFLQNYSEAVTTSE